ncbi:stage III sporulation protein AE [Parablautia intestinalis]|uniref:stage III sporulation protein AE n=1 Tax=Parablautia intestinalis TaxID=2320100 RepID=UPI00259CD726|nr:stage III sporulation protein AE [Parablautia intestinalis]
MKKSRRLLTVWGMVIISFFLQGIKVYASEEKEEKTSEYDYIDKWLSSNDFSKVNEGMDSLFPDMEMDSGELLVMIMEGNVLEAVKMFAGQVKDNLAGEWSGLRQIFIYILVLGVVSALFAEFSDLFSGRQLAQSGFFFLYLFLMAILTKVILFVSDIATEAIENIVLFVKLFVPTYCVAVGAAQGAASGLYYYQLMLVVAYLVESFLIHAMVPFIYSYVILSLLNGFWAEEKLTLLLDFIEKGIGLALKVAMGAITGLSLVQAVIVPVASGLRISAMRKAVSAIPGIGGVTEGVAELVLGSAVLIKNSMGVLLLTVLFGACLVPLVKILIVTVTVKLGAAITGIISDKRISLCADRVGGGCLLFLRCVGTSMILFIIVVAVVSYTIS